jgi:hypothetical protein
VPSRSENSYDRFSMARQSALRESPRSLAASFVGHEINCRRGAAFAAALVVAHSVGLGFFCELAGVVSGATVFLFRVGCHDILSGPYVASPEGAGLLVDAAAFGFGMWGRRAVGSFPSVPILAGKRKGWCARSVTPLRVVVGFLWRVQTNSPPPEVGVLV